MHTKAAEVVGADDAHQRDNVFLKVGQRVKFQDYNFNNSLAVQCSFGIIVYYAIVALSMPASVNSFSMNSQEYSFDRSYDDGAERVRRDGGDGRCVCSGKTYQYRGGSDCQSTSDGNGQWRKEKPYCYVDPGACIDGVTSRKLYDAELSSIPCRWGSFVWGSPGLYTIMYFGGMCYFVAILAVVSDVSAPHCFLLHRYIGSFSFFAC